MYFFYSSGMVWIRWAATGLQRGASAGASHAGPVPDGVCRGEAIALPGYLSRGLKLDQTSFHMILEMVGDVTEYFLVFCSGESHCWEDEKKWSVMDLGSLRFLKLRKEFKSQLLFF